MTYEAFHDELRDTRLPLNNGAGSMPAMGFGTLLRNLGTTTEAVRCALETGFRHFDCAERYRNEDKVGVAFQQAFAAGSVRREDVFITTKLWNTNHRPERVKPAFEASCQRLRVDYIDCYPRDRPYTLPT
jgi:diketogulonate reductase-like aldo/keto reductase